MRPTGALTSMGVAALLLVACGGGQPSNQGTSSRSAPGTTPSATVSLPVSPTCSPDGSTLKLIAKDIAFEPTCLAVSANTSFQLVFENQDSGITHNVDIYSPQDP